MDAFRLPCFRRAWFDRAVSAPRSFLRYWLPVLLWLAVIFSVSTNAGSAQHTSRFFKPFLRWLMPGVSEETLERFHFYVRKQGHVCEYAVLAMLLIRAARRPRADGLRPPWRRGLVVATLAACAVAAAGDEGWQSIWSDRLASPLDVVIDTTGAALGLLAAWLWSRWRERG